MELHSFSTEDNRTFWSGNQSTYHGQRQARWLLFLARDYVGRKVLDAGAGDGALVRQLRGLLPGVEITGIDLAPKSEEIQQGDLTSMPFADGAYDTVICSEVLEHVADDVARRILDELHRVLAPGGALIITTPYRERLEDAAVTCPQCGCHFHRYGHQRSFDEEVLTALVGACGFDVEVAMPVKMSRVRRYRFLGYRFFRTAFMQARSRRMRGKRSLVVMARKPS